MVCINKSIEEFCAAFLCATFLFFALLGHECQAEVRLPADSHRQIQEAWQDFVSRSLPVMGIVEASLPGDTERRSYVEWSAMDRTGGVLIHANFDAAGDVKPPVSAWVANSEYLASLRSEDWQESFGIEGAGAASWSLIGLEYRSNKSPEAKAAIEEAERVFISPNNFLLGEAFAMRRNFPEDHQEVGVIENSENRLTLQWQLQSSAENSPRKVFEVSLEPHRFYCVKSAVITSYSSDGMPDSSFSFDFESSGERSLPVIDTCLATKSDRSGSKSVLVKFEVDCPASAVDPRSFKISHFGFPEPRLSTVSNRFHRGFLVVLFAMLSLASGFALKRHARLKAERT